MYGVVLEDYEWDYETWSEAGKDRHASNHYPTSQVTPIPPPRSWRGPTTASAARRRIACFYVDDLPHQAVAMDVLRLRGFTYKSSICGTRWSPVPAIWTRNQHEQILIGVRGKVPCPAPGSNGRADHLREEAGALGQARAVVSFDRIVFPQRSQDRTELPRRTAAGWSAWGMRRNWMRRRNDHHRRRRRGHPD